MLCKPKYAKQINREKTIASFIPYSSHIASNIISTKEGDLLRIWRLDGINHETEDPQTIQLRMDQLNTLFRSIGSEHVALWTHNVRRQISDRLHAAFENDFCREFDKKYYDSFLDGRMMVNEIFLSLIYRPIPSRISKAIAKSSRRSLDEIKADQQKAVQKMNELAYQLESSLRLYGLEELKTYEDEQGILCSNMLEFLHFINSGEWQKVRVPCTSLDAYLGTAWLFVGTETIEIRTLKRTRYAQAIDFKDYISHTEPGLLNNLMYENYEYVLTQSYSFFSKNNGKKYLERQQKQLQNTEDGSVTQIAEISTAIDELIQGEFLMGEYHFSMLIFGDSIEQLHRNVASSRTIIQDLGFLASLVSTATDAAYYAQLPCNWFFRPRVAVLTSKNFAALSSFHNFSTGKRDGNPWGQAVTMFKTPSGQPFFFNYHSSREEEDSSGQKLLGNTKIIGQSGSGKTVLTIMLLLQSQKFAQKSQDSFTTVFFDKDRGAEIAIRTMGGKYLALKNGVSTGMNPFSMEPTENNIVFLERLVRWIASNGCQLLTTADEIRISEAVRTVMRMPTEKRRLKTVTQNLIESTDKENSILKRLIRWCQGGELGWVLDNSDDLIDFSTHKNYGFDGTDFLDNTLVRAPIAMYLLHRMESIIDGRRFIYYMDEFWKWLRDDTFSDFAFNKQKTIRKQNGLGVFITQSPEDILKSSISRALIEQCQTGLFLPNPAADAHEYMEGFKLTKSEFNIVKNLDENSRMFLVKQGHRSAIAQLDLSGFDDELAVMSGNTENIELLDAIMEEFKDGSNMWLQIFHERRKTRRTKAFLVGE